MILAEDHDPGRGSWSWQRIKILADKHVFAGALWFWLRTRNHHAQTTSGPPRDHFRPSSKINFQAFLDQFGVKVCPSGPHIISKRRTKKIHSHVFVMCAYFGCWEHEWTPESTMSFATVTWLTCAMLFQHRFRPFWCINGNRAWESEILFFSFYSSNRTRASRDTLSSWEFRLPTRSTNWFVHVALPCVGEWIVR